MTLRKMSLMEEYVQKTRDIDIDYIYGVDYGCIEGTICLVNQ